MEKSYFSKDPKAGGTWFVANADGVIWFLNGADESMKHNFRIEKPWLDCFRNDQQHRQRISGMKLIWKT
jgi:hypothetical protein